MQKQHRRRGMQTGWGRESKGCSSLLEMPFSPFTYFLSTTIIISSKYFQFITRPTFGFHWYKAHKAKARPRQDKKDVNVSIITQVTSSPPGHLLTQSHQSFLQSICHMGNPGMPAAGDGWMNEWNVWCMAMVVGKGMVWWCMMRMDDRISGIGFQESK